MADMTSNCFDCKERSMSLSKAFLIASIRLQAVLIATYVMLCRSGFFSHMNFHMWVINDEVTHFEREM